MNNTEIINIQYNIYKNLNFQNEELFKIIKSGIAEKIRQQIEKGININEIEKTIKEILWK